MTPTEPKTGDSATAGNAFARWLADDSFPAPPPDLAVYRYKGMIWFGPVFLGLIFITALSILATLPRSEVGGYVGIPLIMWAAAAIGWLAIVTSAVRVRAGALVIDNMVVRHVIPWTRFAGLYVETGMGMFARLDDGTVIRLAAFGRSLADALKGYTHMRETLSRLRDDCRAARQAGPRVTDAQAYVHRLNVPWAAVLAFGAFFEAFAWIAFAVHGG